MSLLALLAPIADDIIEIRGPILPPPEHPWWPYAVFAAAVLVLGLAVRAWRRRRRKQQPADLEALRAIDEARPLIERGDPQGFSTLVSDAVRRYVETAFAMHAPRLTTPELLAELMADDSPVAGHRAQLGAFLEYCDLAKYARWSLSRTDMNGMLASAQTFVRATAPPAGGRP